MTSRINICLYLFSFFLLIGCNQQKDTSGSESEPVMGSKDPLKVGETTHSDEDTRRMLSTEYTGVSYSPYAEREFASRPLWGETHLHTGLSMDAGGFGNRLGVRDAYRFARGEQITSSKGITARLSRPLDWLVVADHSDGLGFITDLLAAEPFVLEYEQGKRWSDGFRAGGQEAVEATLNLITTFSQGEVNPELLGNYSPGADRYRTIWDDVIAAAEEFNDPGNFTAFIGF